MRPTFSRLRGGFLLVHTLHGGRPMTYAGTLRGLIYFVPLSIFTSGCVVSCHDGNDDYECDNEKCCDEYGCYPYDDDDDGYPGNGGYANTTSGFGGAGQGGEGAAGGAPPACDSSVIVCACTDSSECSAGYACLGGQCLSPCTFDYECGDDHVCADGLCVAACDAETPCPAGSSCWNGGCIADPTFTECAVDEECNGLFCVNGHCTVHCDSNAACPAGELCDAATGACFADPSPQPVCDDATPCSGGGQSCLDDGFCHYGCSTVEECKLIDSRFDACDNGVCKTDTELSPACTYESPCADGSPCVSNECVVPKP
ncbi:MAG: hypothetical protein HOW73_39285 [Polyangiaceae bacterium]|nr:hypothetical protein [Polyangiaceae bacterium]